jgi:hypothetical protein
MMMELKKLKHCTFSNCAGLIYVTGVPVSPEESKTPFKRLGEHLVLVYGNVGRDTTKSVNELTSEIQAAVSLESVQAATKEFILQVGASAWDLS